MFKKEQKCLSPLTSLGQIESILERGVRQELGVDSNAKTESHKRKVPMLMRGNRTDRFGRSNHSFRGPGRKGFRSPGNECCKYWNAALEGSDVGGLGDLGPRDCS